MPLDLVAVGATPACIGQTGQLLVGPPATFSILTSTNPDCPAPVTFNLVELQVPADAGAQVLGGNFAGGIEPDPWGIGGIFDPLRTALEGDVGAGSGPSPYQPTPPFVSPALLSNLPDGWDYAVDAALADQPACAADLTVLSDRLAAGNTLGESVAELRGILGKPRMRSVLEHLLKHRLSRLEKARAARPLNHTELYVFRIASASLAHLDRTLNELK